MAESASEQSAEENLGAIFDGRESAFVASHYFEYPVAIPLLNAGRDRAQANLTGSHDQKLSNS